MTSTLKTKLPENISKLSQFRRERLNELLSLMNDNEQVLGILLGGSCSYKDDFAKSDIDLFCLINNVERFVSTLKENLLRLADVDEIIFQGNFPWTEKLHTIYFKHDIDFSIDLCLINSDNADTFFWEPDGFILADKKQIIDRCRSKQMSSPDFTRQPFLKLTPFSLSVVTLKKIEKNLSRNHLWNALEQLNSLRRNVMQIIRLKEVKDYNFLGRVDRDIEDVIPAETNLLLSKTLAVYDVKDIAQKTISLIEIFVTLQEHLKNGNEKEFHEWIFKQVKHEVAKLQNYF